ncbi:MAG TPA: 50S ribosomal protein L25 [Syntrophales bacterium]|nr:50S ribosomal protein L25 [Syntrophales bacterium]HOM06698.1 50S ribosomal protein L25 [Syntrophales bacterium]HOO00114.1 50S ribosomal protein L25 [Syntrophales bacterium]HPC01620.1 50S ribosomal protein L25 [Syntrophales bacterium]HPQ06359.1 50S ribosomal protein L25 [Syntrophales bacterium]
MEAEQLKAFTRNSTGKGPCRRLRLKGMVPAVLYGPKTEPMTLSVNAKELTKILSRGGEKKFVNLRVEEDGKVVEKLILVKDFALHPLKGSLIHADFYEIDMASKITVDIPIQTTGTSPGVAIGGELQLMKRTLRVSCLPSAMPEHIEADISGLNVGDALKVKDLPAMEGVTVMDGEDTVLVYIAATRASMKAMEEAEAAAGRR